MTTTVWRNLLHKFIVAIGFMALITIMAGTNASGSTQGLTFSTELFETQSEVLSPLLVSQCEKGSWLGGILLNPSRKSGEVCTIKEGPNNDGKRFTYIER